MLKIVIITKTYFIVLKLVNKFYNKTDPNL